MVVEKLNTAIMLGLFRNAISGTQQVKDTEIE